MKKLTVKDFAAKLRKKFPGELDNLDDNTLVYRWLKKYPKDSEYLDKTDALSSGFNFTKDNVVSWFKKEKEKVATDSTVKAVKDKVTDLFDKTKTNITPTPPQEKTTTSPPEEKTVTTNYVTKYPSTQNPKKAFTWKSCDENTYPWTYGCKNNKIGQMNMNLFGDRYGDIFGDELMNALEAYGYFGGPNEKKGEISKTIYDKVTVRDAQQQNESVNKKVVKETVKKVLKERLNKK